MNSFILRAVGNLARNPEALAKGALGYARFCLVGSDPEEQQTQHVVTSLWLLAFDDIANDLLKHARKGDQLILEARVRSSCRTEGDGCYRCQNVFIVTGLRYGAKRGGPNSAAECVDLPPPHPVPPETEVAMMMTR